MENYSASRDLKEREKANIRDFLLWYFREEDAYSPNSKGASRKTQLRPRARFPGSAGSQEPSTELPGVGERDGRARAAKVGPRLP